PPAPVARYHGCRSVRRASECVAFDAGSRARSARLPTGLLFLLQQLRQRRGAGFLEQGAELHVAAMTLGEMLAVFLAQGLDQRVAAFLVNLAAFIAGTVIQADRLMLFLHAILQQRAGIHE